MQPHRLNVVGPFYVVDGCCTACGVPEAVAPQLFAWDGSNHCYVRKQPTGPDEMRQMVDAIAGAELPCIRYRGRDQDVLLALKNIGEIDQCDHLGWNGLWRRLGAWLRTGRR
jgi:hypothetical protein